jgi:peptidoglycan/LPS O-acetylase OafA/YrhL
VGPLGVQLFFVLSGFLITRILLQGRTAWQGGRGEARREVQRFYVRRSLRILPAFYFLLLVSVVLNVEPFRTTFGWHAAYLTNFYVAREGQWMGPASHLWTLAVEEQFYLLWPWLVWRLPTRVMPFFLATACALGPLSRAIVLHASDDPIATLTVTSSCFDYFGAGGVVAWLRFRQGPAAPALRWGEAAGLVVLPLALCAVSLTPAGFLKQAVFPFGVALGFAALVSVCARGVRGRCGRVLEWSPLLWLGRLSYGVYLWHNHAPWLGPRILSRLRGAEGAYFRSELAQIAYYTALTLIMAAASWYLLEQPINRWKERLSRPAASHPKGERA